MADWYCSSAIFASVAAFVASHAYSIGDFVKATAPAAGREYVFRCTTAGTSSTEPTWSTAYADGATIVSGGATFTNVAGRSAYGWSAAAGTLQALVTTAAYRPNPGDRVFLSSDHSESGAGTNYGNGVNNGNDAWALVQYISVNRAGSVPPVAGDIANGAAIIATSSVFLDARCNSFWQGITFTGATNTNIAINSSGGKAHLFKDCAFVLQGTGSLINGNTARVTLDNTTIQFGGTGASIRTSVAPPFDFTWINTPSAIPGATIPNNLFTVSGGGNLITCRGVDLSAITTCLDAVAVSGQSHSKLLFDSCRIAAGVARMTIAVGVSANPGEEVELVNCWDGTNVINERYTPVGAIVTDRNAYLSGGAQDDVGNYSLRLTPSLRPDFAVMPLECFAFDVENAAVGASKTATVEIVSSLALNNNDIRLLLEYMGTSGNPIASFGDNLSSVLAAASALPSSSATWTAPSSTTWNPNDVVNTTLSGGNLVATMTSTAGGGVRAPVALSSGKYYWEFTFTHFTQTVSGAGLGPATIAIPASANGAGITGFGGGGSAYINGAVQAGGTGTRADGDIIGIAVDLTAQLIWFRISPSGAWNAGGSANPATGVGGFSISALSFPLAPIVTLPSVAGQIITGNFGASSFSGTVPSGFNAGWPGLPSSKQLLQVTFTPQRAGRVRGLVRAGKPSTASIWVNPAIAIT